MESTSSIGSTIETDIADHRTSNSTNLALPVGLGVGGGVLCVLTIVLVIMCLQLRKKRRSREATPKPPMPHISDLHIVSVDNALPAYPHNVVEDTDSGETSNHIKDVYREYCEKPSQHNNSRLLHSISNFSNGCDGVPPLPQRRSKAIDISKAPLEGRMTLTERIASTLSLRIPPEILSTKVPVGGKRSLEAGSSLEAGAEGSITSAESVVGGNQEMGVKAAEEPARHLVPIPASVAPNPAPVDPNLSSIDPLNEHISTVPEEQIYSQALPITDKLESLFPSGVRHPPLMSTDSPLLMQKRALAVAVESSSQVISKVDRLAGFEEYATAESVKLDNEELSSGCAPTSQSQSSSTERAVDRPRRASHDVPRTMNMLRRTSDDAQWIVAINTCGPNGSRICSDTDFALQQRVTPPPSLSPPVTSPPPPPRPSSIELTAAALATADNSIWHLPACVEPTMFSFDRAVLSPQHSDSSSSSFSPRLPHGRSPAHAQKKPKPVPRSKAAFDIHQQPYRQDHVAYDGGGGEDSAELLYTNVAEAARASPATSKPTTPMPPPRGTGASGSIPDIGDTISLKKGRAPAPFPKSETLISATHQNHKDGSVGRSAMPVPPSNAPPHPVHKTVDLNQPIPTNVTIDSKGLGKGYIPMAGTVSTSGVSHSMNTETPPPHGMLTSLHTKVPPPPVIPLPTYPDGKALGYVQILADPPAVRESTVPYYNVGDQRSDERLYGNVFDRIIPPPKHSETKHDDHDYY